MADLVATVRALPEEELATWLVQQRWFGSKARELSAFHVLDVVPLRREEPELALALIEARFGAGTHDLYQLLVGTGEGREQIGASGLHDALADPPEAALLARLMLDRADLAAADGRVNFSWTGSLPAPADASNVRAIGAEQSNSSIVFDEQLVLKVFRRLEAGINPELELLRFLSARAFPNIAALGGWYQLTGERMEATLGVLQRFIPGARDGWELALDHATSGDAAAFGDEARQLGIVTGRLHTALASDASEPDFAPEEPSAEALSLLSATIDEAIERAFLELPDVLPALDPIRGRREEVRDRLQLLSHASVGGKLIRIHGDYHLGQCLRTTADEWVILDFEGEPARPLVERRRKRSPLRDVAGMLRSFSYVAAAGPMLRGAQVPAAWEDNVRGAFLAGYLEAVDPALLPAGESATRKLLSIFELEKAIYELRYELNNRPDWLPIPVAAITGLLEAPLP